MTEHATPTKPGDVVELRVHGVGGSPPESILDASPVVQLSGDAFAGCWE